jgi:RNA polymerase sigma-70 factor (ECF subfamily)
MRIPPRREPPIINELDLYRRALKRDPVILADLFEALAEKIIKFVMNDLKCSEDTADNAVFDALTDYVEQPERYDPQKGRLLTYLTQAAKYQAKDRLKSEAATARREQEFGRVVELWRRTPKEEMENAVEASRVMEQLRKRGLLKDEDMAAFELIMKGERSTERLAQALGLGALPLEQMRREVKRHRDRLMKILERFGKEDPDDPA